jgi:dihydrofolate synthase/folylpolyglutamate synthase
VPADALTRIRARGHIGIRLGLERMRALLGELDEPQRSLHGVLIGGTNGKGSTAAMVAAMVQEAGYRTARSPSPHLSTYRERILVDGRPITAADLDGLLEETLRASAPGEAEHGPATEFELLTAAAWLWAARQGVDVLVMEVGLGGRLDASNTWAAEVAAITNVGLDHQEYLGHTIRVVAEEKAAIIKAGSRAVSGATGEALEVIAARAREVGAPLQVCVPLEIAAMDLKGLRLRHPRMGELHTPLLGRHQAANASVALGIVSQLAVASVAHVSPTAVARGLAHARWPGRLERIDRDGCLILLDGAHNPDGAAALAGTLDDLAAELPDGRATLLLAVMGDKVVEDIIAALRTSSLLDGAAMVATRVPDSDRSLAPAELAAAWLATPSARRAESRAEAIVDADAALERALELAATAGGPLIVAGSLYLVGYLRGRLAPDDDGG